MQFFLLCVVIATESGLHFTSMGGLLGVLYEFLRVDYKKMENVLPLKDLYGDKIEDFVGTQDIVLIHSFV